MLKQSIKILKPFGCISAYFFFSVLVIIISPFVSFGTENMHKAGSSVIEARNQEMGAFDSLAYIEQFLGVTLQTTSEQGGGVKVIDKLHGHRLQKGISTAEVVIGISTIYLGFAVMGISGEFSIKGAIITEIGVFIKSELQWHWKRIKNTTDLIQTIFEIGKEKQKYTEFLTFKIRKSLGATKCNLKISELNLASVVNTSNEKARNLILTENINNAIAAYADLIAKDSTNAVLLAEDAYALALAGVYDAALMRLDRSWSIGDNSSDVNYLTGQVFALMGYDDITNEIWKTSAKYKVPAWIASKSEILLQKYKVKFQIAAISNREELISKFKYANELASKNLYFQSIALFHKIIMLYPNEYLPYVGYSITLEKTGALEKSAQAIEKAISLIGDKAEDGGKKQFLTQRLGSIKQKITFIPLDAMPGLYQMKELDPKTPQMLAYAGGMLSSSSTSINGRLGYFISGSSNASVDFGIMNSSGSSFSNIGLSVYNRKNNYVAGTGILLSSGGGNTALSIKLSVGFSKMNKAQTTSYDIFLDVNKGLATGSLTTFGLSIGTSFYFGKRK